ncbi:MAG: response regulator transcription factor [Rothia sp. (in: high G+C Gram-positive bacteria)]|uniref:response regulator transcription factor n=1 Tax=Rothia sp. (in: high G+C Gram-positive bacteria) TaxID=1885016 RepID=UPI0026F9D754|nr:response regulator transcription factor [Rothia sp. (in: high G+C Gram-positive bacteria)]
MTLKVLLADDQDMVRSGFALILSMEGDIEVVGQARNGKEALELAASVRPDVVLMDVQMPVMDGITATAALTEQLPGTAVLILTTFDREDYLFSALQAGASGFLLKTSDADELVAAIRKVAGGLALLSPEMTLPLIARFVEQTKGQDAATPAGRAGQRQAGGALATSDLSPDDAFALAALTPREKETLELLAQGLTNAEIAEKLFLGAATVKTHVSNILAKTHSRDRVAAVIFAHRVGLAG